MRIFWANELVPFLSDVFMAQGAHLFLIIIIFVSGLHFVSQLKSRFSHIQRRNLMRIPFKIW